MADDLSPITKSLTVPLPRDAAFRLFTEGLDSWWPVETHSLAAAKGERPARVTVEPREGGHITEHGTDGATALWGTVTDWRENELFAFDWHVGRDPEEATQVRVRFLPTDTGTRVELEHGGWDRLGETAMARRDSYVTGWDHVLGRYAQAVPVRA